MLFRCVRCLYPNTKPDLHFNEEGLCSACQAYNQRATISWSDRQREFQDIVHKNPGKTHDVVVACSGGKDSTWQVIKCLELGLRPLAVTATTDHLSELGRRNLDNIKTICDHVEVSVNKVTRAKIAKFALMELGDISWAEHHLIWSIPAHEAINRSIPIVLYGECPQNEYGAGPTGSESQPNLTKAWIDEFGGLLGLRLDDLADILDIPQTDLELYRYPKDTQKIKALFMGAFFQWDGWKNYIVAREHGFATYNYQGMGQVAGKGLVEGAGYNYENLDNLQTGIHDYLRFLKFGYSRYTDIASNHIRRGRLTRKVAARLAARYDGEYPSTYLGEPLLSILYNIDMTIAEFDAACVRFENREVTAWALKPESYQSFYGTTTDASKADSLAQAVA